MNCLSRSSWRQETKNLTQLMRRVKKGKKNLILNFHFKEDQKEEERRNFLWEINNKLLKFLCYWSLLSIAISSMSFICPTHDLLFKVHAIKHSLFPLCAFEMEIFRPTPSTFSDKRCSLSQNENDFFRKKNEFVVYNGKMGKKKSFIYHLVSFILIQMIQKKVSWA